MFRIEPTRIDGCFVVRPMVSRDERGSFVKIFNRTGFEQLGLCSRFDEQFYSVSNRNSLRGMHFQVPPFDQAKLVFCVKGRAHDVVLDLRKGSRSYGSCESFEIDSDDPAVLYIPRGMAHGFYAYEDDTVLVYSVETVYSKECDLGILWNSFGHAWPTSDPVLSPRDSGHPAFADFDSPFASPI